MRNKKKKFSKLQKFINARKDSKYNNVLLRDKNGKISSYIIYQIILRGGTSYYVVNKIIDREPLNKMKVEILERDDELNIFIPVNKDTYNIIYEIYVLNLLFGQDKNEL